MKLTLTILTGTNAIIEAGFSEDAEMETMITYNGRRKRLSPWKARVVENAVRERHEVEQCIADAIFEKNGRKYAY